MSAAAMASMPSATSAPSLIAIDRSRAAIATILPRDAGASAAIADWRALPLPDHGVDLVLADGALTCLPFPAGYTALAAELARVLAPGGRVVTRAFVAPPPAEREPLAAIDPATSSTIHALKWRVAMAAGQPTNLPVRDLLAAVDRRFPDRAPLHARYPADAVATLDHYATSPLVYSFPTLADTLAAFAPHFTARVLLLPTYELGACFPTIVLTSPTGPIAAR
jgi:SAM-dependent methyltransferase